MKKTITLFILLFILSIGQMWGGNRRIYLDYSLVTWWTNDAKIVDASNRNYMGCHAWNATSSADYAMDFVPNETTLLYCDIDDSYTSLLFFRCTELSMSSGSLWDQTQNWGEIGTNNRFKIRDAKGEYDADKGKVLWAESGAGTRWTPGPAIDGLKDPNNPHNQAFVDGSYSTTLAANTVYTIKVLNGTTSYGEDVAVVTSSIEDYTLTSGEPAVRIATAGVGTYTFTWDDENKQLSVAYPSISHPSVDYCYVIEYPWSNRYINIWGSGSGNGTTYPGMDLTNKCKIGNSNYYYFAYGDYTDCEPNDNGDNKTTQKTAGGHGHYLENISSTWGWHNWSFTVELDEQATTLTAPSDPTVEFNGATLTNITPPTRVDAFFEGYWSNAACDETQVINRDGSWVANAAGYTSDSKWIHEGGTATLYAKWSSMLLLYPSEGGFVDFPLTNLSDNTKALYIDKAYFADARPGNRIKIDGPDASVAGNAKFFFGDYDVNHVPGSDFREVSTGSDVLPVYIYLTQEMIDYIQDHDLRIFGQNMTINRVELEVGRADEYDSQPQKVIWMGDYSANDLKTLNICIKGLDVTWSDYANLIIYHNAGHKNYNFNVRTNWEADGIITYLGDGYPHTVPENNYAIVPLTRAESAIEAAGDEVRLLVQRDDQSGEKIPFTITSIVLEKSNVATGSSWSSAIWSQGHAPTTDECAVITAPMTVDADHATAGRVVLDQSSSNTGKLTIQPNKGLDVRLTVKKTMDGSTLATTTPADLILESSSAGNASLIFENDANQATVQMFSKASIPNENTWNWQFMGIPFTSTNALYSYYNSYLYEWQSSGTWTEVANGGTMSPFTGYCITQTAATTYVMDGTLTPNNDVAISIPAGKEFVMANSWSAPILVSGFTNTTLPLTNKTIYLYNTGYNPEGGAAVTEGTESGTYVAIPIHAAPYTGNDLIAPMQGFYVDNTSGSAATITLKYNELVRPSVDRSIIAGPMHAPEKGVLENAQEDNRPVVLKLWANGAVYNDRAVLLERSDFSLGFDNGWDGKKLSFGEVGPSVYVINPLGEPEAVSAIPDLEGTLVGFRAGTNNTCTMSFEYNGEDTFYLNDLQSQQSTQIASENSYTFTCTAGDNEARFIISATPISKTPTDVEPLTAHPSPLTVTKVLLNNHIYIIRDGRMFSMDGMLVK